MLNSTCHLNAFPNLNQTASCICLKDCSSSYKTNNWFKWIFYLSHLPWYFYKPLLHSICFSYTNCFVKSPTLIQNISISLFSPVYAWSRAMQFDTFHFASWGGWTWGQLEILFSWEMYCVHRELSHQSSMFREWSKASVSDLT